MVSIWNTNIYNSQIISPVPPAGLCSTLRDLGDAVEAPDVPVDAPDVLVPHVGPDAGHVVAGVQTRLSAPHLRLAPGIVHGHGTPDVVLTMSGGGQGTDL